MTHIPTPPIPGGSQQEQLGQLRGYLFTLVRRLETALGNLDESNFAPSSAAYTAVKGEVTEGTKQAMAQQAEELRALLVHG